MQELDTDLVYALVSRANKEKVELHLFTAFNVTAAEIRCVSTPFEGVLILAVQLNSCYVRSLKNLNCTFIDSKFARAITAQNFGGTNQSLFRSLSKIQTLQPEYQYQGLVQTYEESR